VRPVKAHGLLEPDELVFQPGQTKPGGATMQFREEAGVTLPMLPGALSPAGHMVIALPDDDSAAAMTNALLASGFRSAELRR
jgi:hypothetical protein